MSTMRASRNAPAGTNVTIHPNHMTHARWLYKQFRGDGMDSASARMNLVFALSLGQRDARTKVQEALR